MDELKAFLTLSPYIISLIIIALVFDFLNGMNDAANAIATVVSTKVLRPAQAVGLAAFCNFAAAFGLPLAVAHTIGKGIVSPSAATPNIVFAALLGAIVWTATATRFGLPISVSHALVGGLLGSGICAAGIGVVQPGIWKVVVFIFLSPLLGLIFGFISMVVILHLVKNKSQSKVDGWFKKLQLISASAFSFSHGANDAQKTMGIIVFLLFGAGYFGITDPKGIYVPIWVVLSAHAAIALGTFFGGWRVIKTLGVRVTKLRPVHGCAAETSGAATIIACSVAGIPVSTTHTITGSIMGVGATRRFSAVRWGVTRTIIWAWILTIPITAVVSGISYFVISYFV